MSPGVRIALSLLVNLALLVALLWLVFGALSLRHHDTSSDRRGPEWNPND